MVFKTFVENSRVPWARGVVALGIDYGNSDAISTSATSAFGDTLSGHTFFMTTFELPTHSEASRSSQMFPNQIRVGFARTKSGTEALLDYSVSAYIYPQGVDGGDAAIPTGNVLYRFSTYSNNAAFNNGGPKQTITLSQIDQTASWRQNILDGANYGSIYSSFVILVSTSVAAGGTLSVITGSSNETHVTRWADTTGSNNWTSTLSADTQAVSLSLAGVTNSHMGLYCGITDWDYGGMARTDVQSSFGTGSSTNLGGQVPQFGGWGGTKMDIDIVLFAVLPGDWHRIEQSIYENIITSRPMTFSYWDPARNDVISQSMNVENISYILQKPRPIHLTIRGLATLIESGEDV